MRIRMVFPLMAALMLSACGKDDTAAKAAAEAKAGDTAAAAISATDFRMTPGQYRSTVSIQKLQAEGLPAQMASMMPKQQTFEYCISAQDAAMGIEGIKKQMAKGNCKYETFQAGGGKVDAVFTCSSGPGVELRSSAKGTYSDTGSQVAVIADMKMPNGKSMHIEQTVKAERIGDCAK